MIALDVCVDKLRVLTGKHGQDAIIVTDCFELPIGESMSLLDEGAPQNFGCMIKEALKGLGIRDRRCAAAIWREDLRFHRVMLPKTSNKKFKAMVYHASNTIPRAEEYYIDYTVERERVTAGKQMADVLFCGVDKKYASAYYETIKAAGLVPYRMDARQNCMHRMLGQNTKINGESIKDKAVLLLNTNNILLGLDLIVDSKSVFERTISVDAGELNDLTFSFNGEEQKAADPLFEKIYDEAQKMMQFSLTRSIKKPVTQVYLHGKRASEPELIQYLEELLAAPVKAVNEITGIKFKENYNGSPLRDILGCASAFSLF